MTLGNASRKDHVEQPHSSGSQPGHPQLASTHEQRASYLPKRAPQSMKSRQGLLRQKRAASSSAIAWTMLAGETQRLRGGHANPATPATFPENFPEFWIRA